MFKVKVTQPWKLTQEVVYVLICMTDCVFYHYQIYICGLDCESHSVTTVTVLLEKIN